MKTILVHLEEKEYKELCKKKGDKTWKEYLMEKNV